VLMPALNESATFRSVVHETQALGFDVCVIDDGSTDNTSTEALETGCSVLRVPVNLGVGGALRCGFRWALSKGYDVVVQLDADGQHSPADVSSLLRAMADSGAHMVIGSRFTDGSGNYDVGRIRRVAMQVLSRRAERMTGVLIRDSTSGFRAIRRPLLDLFATDYPVEYLGDTVEALIEAGRAGAKVVEFPVTMAPRTHGKASAGALASLWYVVRVIIATELAHDRRAGRPPSLPDTHGVA